ncbi:hypothetical protein [Pseudoalteromonas tunicata]|uniref:Uncharacterized protein n=1 Tax=Pseudoalteromonas tunicata D2 TaxID=87626 RepID=A4C8H7_9GAMM|nr:hypothetical protein [Pseudoalteromonas tunicata]ATC93396.1 hypothetical protein PTUN_a0629 [Pseudoalteromonas tunicata]AXT32440.1 hypothetical protein D1819_17475 [Pseudoalteromonas tunicata]EAR28892.1 hypothetical protein PTD2_07609 [Pseudoalteromonas tunicata D2]
MNLQSVVCYMKRLDVKFSLFIAIIYCSYYSLTVFNFQGNINSQQSEVVEIVDFVDDTISAESAKSLVKLYERFVVKDELDPIVDTVVKKLTLEEQLKQSGDLNELFIDDYKLTLKAVIRDNFTKLTYALVLVDNMQTGISELKRVDESSDLYGYRVSIISNKSIKLDIDRSGSLQSINLTMFKNLKPLDTEL